MDRIVLLVDDDGVLIDGLTRRLHREPYTILTATSAEVALRILANRPVDVLVSDEQMPGMNGIELLTEVHRRWPEVVSIMLSGFASAGTVVRALNQGQIFRFLIKPCNGDELVTNIRQALAHRLVLDRTRDLLPLCRRMHQLLSSIERKHPGITRSVETDVATTIIRRDAYNGLDDLADRLAVAIAHGNDVMPGQEPVIIGATATQRRMP